MSSVTVHDCEFLAADGAPQRFWCGPDDPDLLTFQVGAVRLSPSAPFELSETQGWLVEPISAHLGLPEAGPPHDACGDALSVASVLQHLLEKGRLTPEDFLKPPS